MSRQHDHTLAKPVKPVGNDEHGYDNAKAVVKSTRGYHGHKQ